MSKIKTVISVCIAVILLLFCCSGCSTVYSQYSKSRLNNYDGEIPYFRCYYYVDELTGVVYLVGKYGMTVAYDNDGTIMTKDKLDRKECQYDEN